MPNPENLNMNGYFRSNDEATIEAARKGGLKSGEKRKLKAAVRKVLEGAVPEDMTELCRLLEEQGVPQTNDYGIAFAMVVKALSGDKSAADWVRDTAGEKPKDEVEHSGGVVILSGGDQIAD